MCEPEVPQEPAYDVTVGAPCQYGITATAMYEGWVSLTVDDSQSPANARYSPETLDAAVRAFCRVLHEESPVRVTKWASAHAARPGVFFPAS